MRYIEDIPYVEHWVCQLSYHLERLVSMSNLTPLGIAVLFGYIVIVNVRLA
jgi:hypothetical protein